MRFIVVGAGAVGGVIGGRLFEAGNEAVLVTRGAHYEAIKDRGLCLESPGSSNTLAIPVLDRIGDLTVRPDDVIFLTMKSQHTADAVRELAAVALPSTPVFCMQNGVANERTALRMFRHVYGVVTMVPSYHLVPGTVGARSAPVSGILDIGRYPEGTDERASQVAEALSAATFVTETRKDIVRWKYTKLLGNLASAIDVVCGAQARGGPIGRAVKAEAVECLRVAGIDFASDEEDAERRGDIVNARPIEGHGSNASSSWQSLMRSAGSVETDYFNGEIAILGRLHGVPTPVNEGLQYFANKMAREHATAGSVSEEEFLDFVDATRSTVRFDRTDRVAWVILGFGGVMKSR